MSEGSLKIALLSLGLLLSATRSLGDLYLKDDTLLYWSILGVILYGTFILIVGPVSELLAKRNTCFLLALSLFACVSLSFSVFFLLPGTDEPPRRTTSELIPSQVLIENSTILVYDENDCDRDLSINATNFTNCSLVCPIDSLRICETFNYMFLCLSNGNDISFSTDLKLTPVASSSNESCGSEYKLRYANKVDMKLAPGCTLECSTIASWTNLIPAEENIPDSTEFKISYGTGMILIFCLILIVHVDFLIRGEFINLGDKYAYFLLGSVLLHSASPYLERIPGDMSLYLIASSLASALVFISSICCHAGSCRTLSARPPFRAAYVCKQVKSLISHHKLSLLQTAALALCLGMDSSWATSEIYSRDSLLISLHHTKGAILALPLIAFLGDYLFNRFGSSTCLSLSTLCYGLEFISYGTLEALPFAVIHFLLSPLSFALGGFAVLKFAHLKFAQELRLPTYGLLSFIGLPFLGRSMGAFIQRLTWVYVGSSLLLLFVLTHLLKCKWNRRKLPSSDLPEHL